MFCIETVIKLQDHKQNMLETEQLINSKRNREQLTLATPAKTMAEAKAKALAAAKRLLDASGLAYTDHILVGQTAEAIVQHANAAFCDMIAVATRGMGAAANLLLGSVASKVLQLSAVPVMVVK